MEPNPLFLWLIVDQYHVEKPGPMDTFDPGHFDICGRGGSRYISCQRRGICTAVEILRQCLNDLAGFQNAEMPVRQQSDNPPAFRRGMMQHNGSRVGHTGKGGGKHALTFLDLFIGQLPIDLPLEGCARLNNKFVTLCSANCPFNWNSRCSGKFSFPTPL